MLHHRLRAAAGLQASPAVPYDHYWVLDDAGSPWVDTGNVGGVDGSTLGTVGVSTPGIGGASSSPLFSGTGAIQMGDSFDSIISGLNKQFRFGCLIKQTALVASLQVFIGKFTDNTSERQIYAGVFDGKIRVAYFGALNASNFRVFETTSIVITAGVEHSVDVVYDGTAAFNDRVTVVVDGVPQALTITASSGLPSSIPDGPAKFAVGASVSSTDFLKYQFSGNVANAYITPGLS